MDEICDEHCDMFFIQVGPCRERGCKGLFFCRTWVRHELALSNPHYQPTSLEQKLL